jgi:hypothetical protein
LQGVIPATNITAGEWHFVLERKGDLFKRLWEMPVKLGKIAAKIAQGIRTSANEVYVLDLISFDGDLITVKSEKFIQNFQIEKELVSFFLKGKEIKSYQILPSDKIVIIPYCIKDGKSELINENKFKANFPKTFSYLYENKKFLENREKGKMKGNKWYAYVYPKNLDIMGSSKILVPDIADRSAFALDEKGEYAFTSGYAIIFKEDIKESSKYILGLLNSNVLEFFARKTSTTLRGGFYRYFSKFLEQLPMRPINFDDPADQARHDRLVGLVENMLAWRRQLAAAQTPQEQEVLQRQIAAADRAIDQLVYELYALTPEEIELVESER